MPRLTRKEIHTLKVRFAKWDKPEALRLASRAIMDHVGSETLFNQAGLTFITEAYAAGVFAELRQAALVRLIADEWPDFELRFSNGETEAFEFVEADREGRRRGLEYQKLSTQEYLTEDWPVEEWIADAEQVPSILRDRAIKKAAKNYPSTASLLIYLNIQEFGIRQSEIVSSFSEAVEPARNRFRSIWILWKDRAYEA